MKKLFKKDRVKHNKNNQKLNKLVQAELDMKMQELQQRDQANIRDNETRLLIATMNSQSQEEDGIIEIDPSQKEELFEKIRQFDAKLNLDKDKFKLDKTKT